MSSLFDQRIQTLAREMKRAGIDALFASSPVTMSYLHGFGEGGHERFLALGFHVDGHVALICPALTETQARACGIGDVRPWKDGDDPMVLFRQLASQWKLRSSVIAVDDDMPAAMLLKMQQALPAALFRPALDVVSRLMAEKDADELTKLRQAAAIADGAFPVALRALKPGATERQVAEAIKGAMAEAGGFPEFCIVAAGPNGAMPHHLTDDTVIQPGDVVIMDFGCSVDGYLSDITRTVCVGTASDEAKRTYETVYRAFTAGIAAAKPGVACEEVDRAARTVIQEAGQGDYFVHRTGHGIGMRGHEPPYIVAGNHTPLHVGNCFSVEPGIYFPGKFGVRIENIVTVTPQGAESLNEIPSATLIEVA